MASRYRLLDTAGGEMGIVEDERASIRIGDVVTLPAGSSGTVVDVTTTSTAEKAAW
jgi:hypothetical protein